MHYVMYIYCCFLLLKVEIFVMWLFAAPLISVLYYSAVGTSNDVTTNLIYEFITDNRLKAAVAMTCWQTAGNGCLYSRLVAILIVLSEDRHVTEQHNNKRKVNGQTQVTYWLRSHDREMNNAVHLTGNCTGTTSSF
jgi:hypothetical protein